MPRVPYDSEKPWTRQPFDTDWSWALFSEYLFLPPPRQLRLLIRPGLHWSTIEDLSRQDIWRERAACWDRHLDQLRLETIERVTEETARQRAERQGKQGKKLARMGELAVDRLTRLLEASPEFGATEVSCRDAIRAIGIGVRVERLALGENTDRVDSGPDLSTWSVEDLRALKALQEKAGQP